MGGAHSRTKGHAFERYVATLFREIYPEARRLLENHAKDANGVDLLHTGPFRVQCKKYAAYCPITKIQEVQHDPALGEIPVLVTAGDRLEPMAVLPLADFLMMAKAFQGIQDYLQRSS